MQSFFDTTNRNDVEKRFQLLVYTAVCETLAQWMLLHTGRKNDVKIARKRLLLMKIQDGYPLQYVHLAAQYREATGSVTHHDTVGTDRDLQV